MNSFKISFSGQQNIIRHSLVWILIQLFVIVVTAQDVTYVKKHTQELSRQEYFGRGYEFEGDFRAARWIASRFDEYGLQKFSNSFYQEFQFSINTFPGMMETSVDGRILRPGTDYILRKSARTTNSSFKLIHFSNELFGDTAYIRTLEESDLSASALVLDIDFIYSRYDDFKDAMGRVLSLPVPVRIHTTKDPLRCYQMYGLKLREPVVVEMAEGVLNGTEKEIVLNFEAEFIENYTSRNVLGYLEGTSQPDEYLIIAGHYDHLGTMGSNTFFPGADDNASGVAVIIEFARFFSKPENRPSCSVIFMCFGAEEAGLIGSEYFIANCPVPEEKIKLVMNLDMIAYGESGFIVEHGDVLKEHMVTMQNIIDKYTLDVTLIAAEAQEHSDHWPFIQKDIPALFYTSGVKDSKYYHSVGDTYESLTFAKIEDFLVLLREFVYSFD